MKYKVWAMYHPAASLHQPYLLAVLLDDWKNVPKTVDANYTVTPVLKNSPKLFALDTENDAAGKIGHWSIAYRDERGRLCVTPFHGITLPGFSMLDPLTLNKDLALIAKERQVIFHNAKWDLRVMRANGMPIPKPEQVLDTMIAAYCMGLGRQDPRDTGKSGDRMVGGLGLKYLARRHLGMQMDSWERVKDNAERFEEYNAKDSVGTLLLWEQWADKLPQHFYTIDMPLLDVIMAMEDRGIQVDPNFLQKYAQELDERLKGIDLGTLNPYSHKQVAEYVYEKLGYPITKRTESGEPSVDKEVLETIDDPVVQKILEYREIYKERKTYVSAYVNRMDTNGRVHAEFKQTSTATGRLSSANPNLQNVTKGTELRSLFIALPGKLLVVADWQQLELRTFAALTQEGKMLDALHLGRDIHQETADVLGISRDDAKTVNFLMLYGGTAWKISQEFHIPIDDASSMLRKYYGAYPGIKRYHETQRLLAQTERQVINYFGRVRRLDGMFSEDKKTIRDAENQAINTPIQGAGGEIVKLAMIDLHYKHQAPLILQVHDELIFEVDERHARDYGKWLSEYVPTLTTLSGEHFPIDVGLGKNWKEAKDKENKIN